MITPRTTRLVRVADLRAFRSALAPVGVPLAVLMSVLMDYFVWNRPGRDQRLQQHRDRPRPGE